MYRVEIIKHTGSFLKKTNDVLVRINQRLFHDFQPIPADQYIYIKVPGKRRRNIIKSEIITNK